MTVGSFLRIDTGILWISDVNTTEHCLVLAEMKGSQVSMWSVEN